MAMGMSAAMGRGLVSNTMGNPTTATTTNTAAPISRCRAWRRKSSTLGAAELALDSERDLNIGAV
jgi:hypothetical protein